MKNKFLRTLCILLCGVCILSCAACNFSDDIPNSTSSDVTETEPVIITELNQSYNGSILKITATDIKAIHDSGTDNIIVGVKFIVENVSNNDFYLSGKNTSAYVDDVTTSENGGYLFDASGKELGGNIAPGKRSEGYRSVCCSRNAKVVEFSFEESYNLSQNVFFAFDLSAIEITN